MSVEKERWAEENGIGCLSASQAGSALGYRGCISDFIHYERELKHTQLAFRGNSFTSHGIRIEPVARAVYEFWTGNNVIDGGFHIHPEHQFLACSPDGIILNTDGTIGILEIKSPYHSLYAPGKDENMSNGIPKTYMCQMQCQMHVTNSLYCDFFVYLHSNKDRIAWRVQRSDKWWSWALSKLRLVSRAIAGKTVPEALQSRSFHFPAFDFDLIESKLLIPPVESAFLYREPLLEYPLGFEIADGSTCLVYAQEVKFRWTDDPRDEKLIIGEILYTRNKIVQIINHGTETDPFFLVRDIRNDNLHRILGKYLFPIRATRHRSETDLAEPSLSSENGDSPPRKRISLGKDRHDYSDAMTTPIIHSHRDMGEYFSSLEKHANIHIIEGEIPNGHKPSVSKLLEKILDRFTNCTYSSFHDFLSCFIESQKSICQSPSGTEAASSPTRRSSYLCSLHSSLTDQSVQFALSLGGSVSCFEQVALPPAWATPTLVLPAYSDRKKGRRLKSEKAWRGKVGQNIILWNDGCLRQRCAVIEKYWA